MSMDSDTMRVWFSQAMSEMYRSEVPLYGTLLELVGSINRAAASPGSVAGPGRLEAERHGAIRVGLAQEFGLLRRLLAVFGMVPVGYYDLSPAGVPVHSTAFRATDPASLERSPFRLFASLLRLDLIQDAGLRERACSILERRRIIGPRCLALIERFEAEGSLREAQGKEFIAEAVAIFRWQGEAVVDQTTYTALRAAHPLLADIVCFKGPHINHLTPRVLDIDAAQRAMLERGIEVKEVIEGPPRRHAPVLLRQTSFKALAEPIHFADGPGTHTARFGEIEQRGVALTRAGRSLYDRALAAAGQDGFALLPDDHDALRAQGLAYYRYVRVRDDVPGGRDLQGAIDAGSVHAVPILYEDFLPVSAAGIFRSNLAQNSSLSDPPVLQAEGRQDVLEDALERAVLDPFELYAAQSAMSERNLGL